MHTIKQRIDHTLDVFRQFNRRDVVLGLTPADWDLLCALVIEAHAIGRDEPKLTRDVYDGVPIRHLGIGLTSFIAYDFASPVERRFPLEVLEVLEPASA